MNLKDSLERSDYIFTDVDNKIKAEMRKMVIEAIKDSREINWKDLEDYCKILGMENQPNIFTIPEVVIERCLNEVKEEFDNQNTI